MNRHQDTLASALMLHRSGRLSDAETLYRQILSLDARHAESLHLLGMLVFQKGHCATAEDLIRQAIAINRSEALYHSNLGIVLQSRGNLAASVDCYCDAVALKPDYAEAFSNLAVTLSALGRNDEAIAAYERVLALKPNHIQAHLNLGVELLTRGNIADAIAHYRQVLAQQPDCAEALSNLGNALEFQGQFSEAEDCYRHALSLNPECTAAYGNLASILRGRNAFQGALACYDRLLTLKPDSPEAHHSKALVQLLQSDFEAGWKNYEHRWHAGGQTPSRCYPEPLWKGEHLSHGKLFLWAEQGVGDEIMFAGLVPDVLKTGNRCILECDARLVPLFARSFPEVDVVPPGHAAEDFCAHLPTGSLPRLFRASAAAFAATTSPYLTADPALRDSFRTRYAATGRRLVGLAWHTSNQKSSHRRSVELLQLAPLFSTPSLRWISLQYGDHDALEEQIAAANAPVCVDRAVDQLSDIDTFAAQIAALDLVVTIDNSTAHLAGALGVPTFLLLPCARDWRWLVDREDCLWYPAMRLFRQTAAGDWQSVVEKIRQAI